MRSLIRPALFMIARLELLFSVIAFAFGQAWQGGRSTSGVAGIIDQAGISIVIRPTLLGSQAMQTPLGVDVVHNFIVGTDLRSGYPYRTFRVLAVWNGPRQFIVGTYHWLIIAIFILFNGVLKLMYRKKRLQADDQLQIQGCRN